jgi:hypothetical protein
MRTDRCCLAVATATLALGLALPAFAAEEHVMLAPDEIVWKAASAALPAGAEAAVLFGNPAEEGLFVAVRDGGDSRSRQSPASTRGHIRRHAA